MRTITMAFISCLATRSAVAFKAPVQGALGRTLNRSAVRTLATLDSEDSKALYTLGQVWHGEAGTWRWHWWCAGSGSAVVPRARDYRKAASDMRSVFGSLVV